MIVCKSIIAICLLISFNLFSQTGPAGVGSSTNNVLWLKADAGTSTTASNTAISYWNDQSGNSINVTQTLTTLQPSFAVNVLNGMPAIQFDNVSTTNDKMIAPDSPLLDNTSGYTFFTVSRPQNVDNNARVIVSKRTSVSIDQSFMLFFYTGSTFFVDLQTTDNRFNTTTTYSANTNYIIDVVYNGTLSASTRAKTYTGETLEITATESNSLIPDNVSPLLIGTTDATDPRPFGGYIAEIIIYRTTLNDAQRIIVNNHLSAKYNIAITANDKYAGDNAAKGDYDRNVSGVGLEASGSNPTFSTSTTLGFGIKTLTGLDNGDYILAGHATVTNTVNTTDVAGISGTYPARWQRIWYVDVTNTSTSISTDIEFDLLSGGFPSIVPVTASNYKLLYRAATTGSWTEVATASSISGTKIIFSGYSFSDNTNDGYYTIGSTNYIVSPLPIELLYFTALPDGNQVDLCWSTATEINNDFFTIERGADGINFETLFQIDGNGNTVQTINYNSFDKEPLDGLSYYRLKQTNFDGSSTYSKIVSVNLSHDIEGFEIYPNPSDGIINLKLKGIKNKELLIIITDELGKAYYSKTTFIQDYQQNFLLDLGRELPKGTYIISLSYDQKKINKHIVIN